MSLLHHTAKYAGMLPASPGEHDALIHKVLLFSAWGQAGGAALGPTAMIALVLWYVLRRRRRQKHTGHRPIDEEENSRGNLSGGAR